MLSLVVNHMWLVEVTPNAVKLLPDNPLAGASLGHPLVEGLLDDLILGLDAAGALIASEAEREGGEGSARCKLTQVADVILASTILFFEPIGGTSPLVPLEKLDGLLCIEAFLTFD